MCSFWASSSGTAREDVLGNYELLDHVYLKQSKHNYIDQTNTVPTDEHGQNINRLKGGSQSHLAYFAMHQPSAILKHRSWQVVGELQVVHQLQVKQLVQESEW